MKPLLPCLALFATCACEPACDEQPRYPARYHPPIIETLLEGEGEDEADDDDLGSLKVVRAPPPSPGCGRAATEADHLCEMRVQSAQLRRIADALDRLDSRLGLGEPGARGRRR